MAVHFTKKIGDPRLLEHVQLECARELKAVRKGDFAHPRLQEFTQREFRAWREWAFKNDEGIPLIETYLNLRKTIEGAGAHWLSGEGLSRPTMGFMDAGYNPIRANRRVRQWLLDNKLAVQTAIAQQHGLPSYGSRNDPSKRLLFNADFIQHFYRTAERPRVFQYFWHGGVDFVERVYDGESRWFNPKKIEPLTPHDFEPGRHESDSPELAARRRRLDLA